MGNNQEKQPLQRISGTPDVTTNTALLRFLKSMNIGFYEWHDGIGYDLDAFQEMTADELRYVESLLIPRKDHDWRDVEALAALHTPAAIEALKECLQSKNKDAKLFAVRFLKELNVMDKIEDVVVETLPMTKIGDGMSFVLNLVERYPSERIKHKVLWCAMFGNDDIRIHCAAMSLLLYGKAASSFDMKQTIVFEFREKNKSKRHKSFIKLCQIIGEDSNKIMADTQ